MASHCQVECSPYYDDGIVVEWRNTSTCFAVQITACTSEKLPTSGGASSSTTKRWATLRSRAQGSADRGIPRASLRVSARARRDGQARARLSNDAQL